MYTDKVNSDKLNFRKSTNSQRSPLRNRCRDENDTEGLAVGSSSYTYTESPSPIFFVPPYTTQTRRSKTNWLSWIPTITFHRLQHEKENNSHWVVTLTGLNFLIKYLIKSPFRQNICVSMKQSRILTLWMNVIKKIWLLLFCKTLLNY